MRTFQGIANSWKVRMRFVHGRLHALDRNGRVTQGLACADGRVLALGSPRQLARFGGDEVDLQGRTVLPGLIDAHGHLRHLAEALLTADLEGARSQEEAAGRVAEFAREQSRAAWITGRG